MGLNVMRNSHKVLNFSINQISNTALNVGISLILIIVLSWGWQGRVWGIIIAFFLSALASLYYLRKNNYLIFDIKKSLLKEVLGVTVPLIPNSFQSVIISQSGIFFIQFFFTKALLGVYSVGFQISSAVMFLGLTLVMSWSPFFYKNLAKKDAIPKLYITRMLYLITGVLFSGLVFLNIFKGFIISLMTSPEYHGATDFVPYFTLGFFFLIVSNFLLPALIANEKQRFISIISFIGMIMVIVLNLILPKIIGPMGVVYIFSFIYFFRVVAFLVMLQKILPLPWLKALKIWK